MAGTAPEGWHTITVVCDDPRHEGALAEVDTFTRPATGGEWITVEQFGKAPVPQTG